MYVFYFCFNKVILVILQRLTNQVLFKDLLYVFEITTCSNRKFSDIFLWKVVLLYEGVTLRSLETKVLS